jgi:hypothetical protein
VRKLKDREFLTSSESVSPNVELARSLFWIAILQVAKFIIFACAHNFDRFLKIV